MIYDLEGIIALMQSENYRSRFIAEYYQTKIRYNKLHKLIIKLETNTCDFKPSCDISLLKEQAKYMGMYLYTLELRAAYENIDLKNTEELL